MLENKNILEQIKNYIDSIDIENVSDGCHSFKTLYEIRLAYNVAYFNELALHNKYEVHKSKLHYDGKIPFNNKNWFIVSAMLPTGLISNHYEMIYWDLFKIPEYDKCIHKFDGHDTKDVINRLINVKPENKKDSIKIPDDILEHNKKIIFKFIDDRLNNLFCLDDKIDEKN